MIKEDAKFETCDKCGDTKCTRRHIYICDCCGKEVDDSKQLDVTIFFSSHETVDMQFCDWKCIRNYLPNYLITHRELIDFVGLPTVRNVDIDDFLNEMTGK